MTAFGSALFRSHIGSSRHKQHAQIFDDADTMTHFAKFSDIFVFLSDYRSRLMEEAFHYGYPLIRSMIAHFGYDEHCWSLTNQYMFGSEFLVAPVVEPVEKSRKSASFSRQGKNNHGQLLVYEKEKDCDNESTCYKNIDDDKRDLPVSSIRVYIPPHSDWIHLWTGYNVSGGLTGREILVDAPIGFTPIFYHPNSTYGAQLRDFVVKNNYDADGEFDDDAGRCDIGNNNDADDNIHAPNDNLRARIGKIRDYREQDWWEWWWEWLGISEYVTTWNSTLEMTYENEKIFVDPLGGMVSSSTEV
jgi:hypothetical protein